MIIFFFFIQYSTVLQDCNYKGNSHKMTIVYHILYLAGSYKTGTRIELKVALIVQDKYDSV